MTVIKSYSYNLPLAGIEKFWLFLWSYPLTSADSML